MSGSDNRDLEAFRVRQYSEPHAALAAAGGAAAPAASPAAMPTSEQAHEQPAITPDTGRVILHFDCDSFYAQCEEVRNPSLRGRPVGVTQKYLIVTCNYEARSHGVTKLMGLAEARRRCPHIALVSGEDLTPYRAASKQILRVLQRYGTAEKLGLDEIFVDATAEAKRRLASLSRSGGVLAPWQGYVHRSGMQLMQDSRHRPMDLRAVAGSPAITSAAVPECGQDSAPAAYTAAAIACAGNGSGSSAGADWEALLRIGSVIAAEARASVRFEAGYRTSAGIACNKMLAKLCSGLHKPDDQTVLPPPEAAAFVAPLPVRALPGVGYKMEQALVAAGITTAGDLRALPRHQLVQQFGERVGAFLHAACRGKDPSSVQEHGPPKSVTVEDSFKTCPSFQAAAKVVAVLAPDLLARLQEELQDSGRRPGTLAVKWRHGGAGWQRSSASCPMPVQVLASRTAEDHQVAAIAAAAMRLLHQHLWEPFDLSLINLGATAFTQGTSSAAAVVAGSRSIVGMLSAGRTSATGPPAAGCSATGAPDGSVSLPPIPQSRPSSPHQQQLSPVPTGGGRAAAEASAQQRRSYGSVSMQAPLLSKRAERQLREQGAQPQQQPGMQLPPPGAVTSAETAVRQQQQHMLQPPAHAQGHAFQQPAQPFLGGSGQGKPAQPHAAAEAGYGFDTCTFAEGVGDGGVEDEDGADVWDELQGLSAWRSDAPRSRSPSTGVAGLPHPDTMADNGGVVRHQPQQQQQQREQQQQQPRQRLSEAPVPMLPRRGSGTGGTGDVNTISGASLTPQVSLGAPAQSGNGRVVCHADVDCFYCQVERLDDPSLRGVPLAVQQFNAGGFVAVSYEARAAGVRCGDGAGAAGRAAIPHLVRMQAASLEECRRRCPGLQVRSMRTDRYRQVAQQVHALLRTFAPDGQVERTSYDDFYIDFTLACNGKGGSSIGNLPAGSGGQHQPQDETSLFEAATSCPSDGPPEALLFVTGGPLVLASGSKPAGNDTRQQDQPEAARQWQQLPADVQQGIMLATELRRTVFQRLGLVISCGVARNKLLARLASPLCKPDGLAVVPDAAAVPFICGVPLQKVPHLRGKFGATVASELGVSTVGDLAAYPRPDLVRRFGEQQGAFLAALPLAQDDSPVRERGPQKSLAVERSFPPLPSEAAAAAELAPLAHTLLERAAQDAVDHNRRPSKLVVQYRQGYGSNPRSRSVAVPREVLVWLHVAPGGAPAQQQLPEQAEKQHMVEGQAAGTAAPPAAAGQDLQLQGQQAPKDVRQMHTGPAPAGAVVAAALALLRPAVAAYGWQLTRLAVALAYNESGSRGGASGQTARGTNQLGIATFMQRSKADPLQACNQQASTAARAGEGDASLVSADKEPQQPTNGTASLPQHAANEEAAARLLPLPHDQGKYETQEEPGAQAQQHRRPPQQQQQHLQPVAKQPQHQPQLQQPQPPQQPPQQQSKQAVVPAGKRPASYRNVEALAIRQLFGSSCSSSSSSTIPGQQGRAGAAIDGGSKAGSLGGTGNPLVAPNVAPEERASLELALRLQQEEVMAAAAAACKRNVSAVTGSGSGTRQQKQRRIKSGPLDSFFKKKGGS